MNQREQFSFKKESLFRFQFFFPFDTVEKWKREKEAKILPWAFL